MTTFFLIITIILLLINITLLLRANKKNDITPQLKDMENNIIRFNTNLERMESAIKDEFQRNRKETSETAKTNRDELATSLTAFSTQLSKDNKESNELLRQKFEDFNKRQLETNKLALENIKAVQNTIEKNLKAIREDNALQLNEMRKTVDEKLQTTLEKRLGESFKQVSERLEQVHKGLGEMQNIATGVGDLKKVLSNVKTRGVLGEYQLANILEQILTPEQYAVNVATKPGSQANVEFAIRLPGKDSDKEVWLPIDSKFPIESYNELLTAFDHGNKEDIESAHKTLTRNVELFAKTINEKYIAPPHTTDFAIMFLPVESLYAEVLRDPGLFETLQRKYKITVTGPTTLAALLNSLQIGFRTLAVQKRSSEVWDILKAVKSEFEVFSNMLAKAHKQVNTASNTLEALRTTRTNVMTRKLKDVESLPVTEAEKILELPPVNNDE